MLRNVAILYPRLDCSFKKGDVPTQEGPPNHPLRKHWETFLNTLYLYHKKRNDTVTVHKAALWQFDLDTVKSYSKKYDLVYMPHKQKEDFDAGDNVLYYMQTVFPWMFTIDHMGWGASMSWSPLSFSNVSDEMLWKKLERYRDQNRSKFPQPERAEIREDNFFVFMCQIPHDETIKYHSSISVLDALKRTHYYSQKLGVPLIVKGHPANPGSMQPMMDYCSANKIKFTFDVSLHDLFKKCRAVFTVNSGSGIEAMLHNKPIITYGRSEYSSAVFRERFDSTWDSLSDDGKISSVLEILDYTKTDTDKLIKTYKYFVTSFFEKCIDSSDFETYKKVDEIVKNSLNRRIN